MQSALLPDNGVESPEAFARRLHLPIKDMLLVSRALTHRSFLNEHPEALEDNERLEFLGDAVLDFVVGAWLYNRYPEMAEGELTRLRAALVNTDQLAEFAASLGLGKALRLSRGERDGGGRNRQAILCGAFEALVGALYLDGELEAVRQFLEPILEIYTHGILIRRDDQDSKSQLQEWAQAQGFPPPHYRIASEKGPDHSKVFHVEVWVNDQVYGFGVGPSKQVASKVAARDALDNIESEAGD